MYRLKRVAELYKGKYKDSEKSDTVIQQWSPNNLRKLIIGEEFVFLEYHVANSKTPQKLVKIDVREESRKDIELLNTEPHRFKSTLNVLRGSRISSCIEEIVFLPMNNRLLETKERSLQDVGSSLDELKSRYPRLSYIYSLNLQGDVERVLDYFLESTSKVPTAGTYELLKSQGIDSEIIATVNGQEWYKGSKLRPQFYSMDSTTLPSHFDRVSREMERKIESDKEKDNKKSNVEAFSKVLPVIKVAKELINRLESVYDGATFVSQIEFLKPIKRKNVSLYLRKHLNGDKTKENKVVDSETVVNQTRAINVKGIYDLLDSTGQLNQETNEALRFIKEDIVEVLYNKEMYTRESNRMSIEDSIKEMYNLSIAFIEFITDLIGVTYASYVLRNGESNAKYFHELPKEPVGDFQYPYSMRKLSHTVIGTQLVRDAYNELGLQEVNEMKTNDRLHLATSMLRAYQTID